MASSEKAKLRAEIRARTQTLGSDERARASLAMAHWLSELPEWIGARGIAAFVGVPERGEPETRPMLEAVLAAGRGLWLPRMRDKTTLDFHRVSRLDELIEGLFGIAEPPPGPRVELSRSAGIDLVLVPGVSFDRKGRRLGSGRGYYDRAIAAVPLEDRPRWLGLCFESALSVDVPTEIHDVVMDAVLTERGLVMPV